MPETLENPANARVYVYWPGQRWREKAGQYPEVQVNGVPVGLLRYKTYLALELPPGRHEFRITGFSEAANWDEQDLFFEMPVEPGETRYVSLFVKYDQSKNNLGDGFMQHVVQFLPRGESQARMEMRGLKLREG